MHFHERTTFGGVSCIGETGSRTHCARNLGFEYPQYNGKWVEGNLIFFCSTTCLQPIFGMIQSTQNQIYCTRSAII